MKLETKRISMGGGRSLGYLLAAVLSLSAVRALATEVFVDAGNSQTYDVSSLTGSDELRKTGLGTLTLTGGSSYSGGAFIDAGTVIAGAQMGNNNNNSVGLAYIFGTTDTVVIAEGGKFDINYQLGYKNFVIAGSGPDGSGALGNWSGRDNGYARGGMHKLTLSGDAKLGGNAWMCVSYLNAASGASVDMNDYTLSVATTGNGFVFASTTFNNGGEVKVLPNGRADFWGNSINFNTTRLTIDEGGSVDMSTGSMVMNVPVLTLVNPTASTRVGNASTWNVGEYVLSNTTDLATLDIRWPLGASTKFVKAGPADFTTGSADMSSVFKNGVAVREGRMYCGGTSSPFGPQFGSIEVENGGTFDTRGANFTSGNYNLTIAGDGHDGNGALQNTGATMNVNSSQMISNIVLSADASVGGTKNFSLTVGGWNPTAIELNGHTLAKTGNNVFGLSSTTVTSTGGQGVFRIDSGTLRIASGLANAATTFTDTDLVIGSGATLDLEAYSVSSTETLVLGNLVCEVGSSIRDGGKALWSSRTAINGDFTLDLSGLAEEDIAPEGQTLLACPLDVAPKALNLTLPVGWTEHVVVTNSTGVYAKHVFQTNSVLTVSDVSDVLVISNDFDCVYSGTLSGVGTIIKLGAGRLTLTGDSQTSFSGTFVVSNGTVVAANRYAFGQNYTGDSMDAASTVIVADGAQVIATAQNFSGRWILSGEGPDGAGALVQISGSIDNGRKAVESLTLAADATIAATNENFAFTRSEYYEIPLTLAGHTLTLNVASGRTMWFSNVQGQDAGTIHLTGEGAFAINSQSSAPASSLPEVSLVTDAGTTLNLAKTLAVSNITCRGSISGNAALTVYGTVEGSLAVNNLVFGDGAVFKPLAVGDTIAIGSSLTLAGRLTVDLSEISADIGDIPSLTLLTGAGDLSGTDVTFTSLPEGWTTTLGTDGQILLSNGAYGLVEDLEWNKGSGTWALNTAVNTNDATQIYLFDDRHNVTFVDAESDTVVTLAESRSLLGFAVSNDTTTVSFAGESGARITATNIVFAGEGERTIGVELRTDGGILAQSGTTTLAKSSWPIGGWTISGGAILGFDIETSGETWRMAGTAHLYGVGTLVKMGAGILEINNSNGSFAGAVEVREGILKGGDRYALGKGGAGDFGDGFCAAVKVSDGAAFDHAGQNITALFELEGTGPDGNGALRNAGHANTFRGDKGADALTLTGDALVKAYGKGYPLVRSIYQELPIDLGGHTLSLGGTTNWTAHAKTVSEGTIDVLSGTTFQIYWANNFQYPSDLGMASLILESGATLQLTAPLTVSNLTCYAGSAIVGEKWPAGLAVTDAFTLDLRPWFAANPNGARTNVLAGDFSGANGDGIEIIGIPDDVAGWAVEKTAEGIFVYNYLILNKWQVAADETMTVVVTGDVTRASAGQLDGYGTIVKTGDGTLTLSGSSQNTFCGTFIVSNGTVAATHRYAFGANDTAAGNNPDKTVSGVKPGVNVSTVVVAEGARVVENVWAQSAYYVLSGSGTDGQGAIVSLFNDNRNGNKGVEGLELAADATISAVSGYFSLVRSGFAELPITFNGHTLTLLIGEGKTIWTGGVRVQDEGSVFVTGGGTFQQRWYNDIGYGGTGDFARASMAIDSGSTLAIESGASLYVGDLAVTGTVSGAGTLKLCGELSGTGTVSVGTIVLSTNAVLACDSFPLAAQTAVAFDTGVESVPVTLANGGSWADVPHNMVVMSWPEGGGPATGTLVPTDATGERAKSVKIEKTSTGFVVKKVGFIILFR